MIYDNCIDTTNENVESAIFNYVRPLDTNEKGVDDERWELKVFLLPKLFIRCNKSTHGHNTRIMDDVTSPWMKNHIEFS